MAVCNFCLVISIHSIFLISSLLRKGSDWRQEVGCRDELLATSPSRILFAWRPDGSALPADVWFTRLQAHAIPLASLSGSLVQTTDGLN